MTDLAHATPSNADEAPADEHFLASSVSPYSTREKIARVLWIYLGMPIFRVTFHNWYGVRRRLLMLFGARLGAHFRIRSSARVEQPWNLTAGSNVSVGDRANIYCLGPVTVGNNVSIAQGAHICAGTHDYRYADLPLVRPPIRIDDHAWIAADAFVGPNTHVGEGAILGARGCATKRLEPWTIYAGNPAVVIKPRPRPVARGEAAR